MIVSDLKLYKTVVSCCIFKIQENLTSNLFVKNLLQPPDTDMNDLNNTNTKVSSHTNSVLNSSAEQTDLLTFVENFPIDSLNSTRPNHRPPLRSRQMGIVSRIDQIWQHSRTSERPARTRFFAARINTWKKGRAQLLEAMQRCRLSKPRKMQTASKLGVFALNGSKPILSKSKTNIVGLPGLFDADLLMELTEDDGSFLGSMKRAIINKDVTSLSKLGSWMAQFWTKTVMVIDWVIVDNKLAIPELLSKAVFARLHRSHLCQKAMMSASE